MQDVTGQIAWITGAGTGIGEAGAIALAEAGCTVVLSGRRVEPLEAVAARITGAGGQADIEPLDVADNDAVIAVAARILRHHGRVDIGVFSAGLNVTERNWPVVTTEAWDDIIGIDLNGAFYCCHAVLPSMRAHGGGLIINISSMAAKGASPLTGPAYTAAKHAMNAMTASLAVEERNNGVRATAICPGEVATPILDLRPIPVSDEDKARLLQSEDLGELIRFVAQMPRHVTLDEILITPTYNRFLAN
ncbi:MAG: SDR family oxidoreductase [Actinomycetia bacterium]|nr:SDR family oxidoreductase [Actinomycetes bacterium]MCP3911359.1 SDR family oxidoreductase [Actinomycetes bacterium]MCP4086339.1 SDR family oxidoreductase [Actinomycetes bacterium]